MASTFIIDCPYCKAKVGAIERGKAENGGFNEEDGEPWGEQVLIGERPKCRSFLVGHSRQTGFESYNAEEDEWSDFVRVYPKPAKSFSSYRIP